MRCRDRNDSPDGKFHGRARVHDLLDPRPGVSSDTDIEAVCEQ